MKNERYAYAVCLLFALVFLLSNSGCLAEHIDCCNRTVGIGKHICPQDLLEQVAAKDEDYSNDELNCTNVSGYCIRTSDNKETPLPVCSESAPCPCVHEHCTAMICGRTPYKPKPQMAPRDMEMSAEKEGEGADVSMVEEPIGLYKSTCEFKELTGKTYRDMKRSKGRQYVNTFRFGVGSNFSDYEEAKNYFPISDVLVSTSTTASRDRYMNYLNLNTAVPPFYTDESTCNFTHKPPPNKSHFYCGRIGQSYACVDDGGGSCSEAQFLCESECKIGGGGWTIAHCTMEGSSPSFLTDSVEYLYTTRDYESFVRRWYKKWKWCCYFKTYHKKTHTEKMKTLYVSEYAKELRKNYKQDLEKGEPALFECAGGADCHSGYCNKEGGYKRSVCINKTSDKPVSCPCWLDRKNNKVYCKMEGSYDPEIYIDPPRWMMILEEGKLKWKIVFGWVNFSAIANNATIPTPNIEINATDGYYIFSNVSPEDQPLIEKCGADYDVKSGYFCTSPWGSTGYCKSRVKGYYVIKELYCKKDTTGKKLDIREYGWCEPLTIVTLAVQHVKPFKKYLNDEKKTYREYCPFEATSPDQDICECVKKEPSKSWYKPWTWWRKDWYSCEECITGPKENYGAQSEPGKYTVGGWPYISPNIAYLHDRIKTYLMANVMPILTLDSGLDPKFISDFNLGDMGAITLVVGTLSSTNPDHIAKLKEKVDDYAKECPSCLIAINVKGDDDTNIQFLNAFFGYPGLMDQNMLKKVDIITHSFVLNDYVPGKCNKGNYSCVLGKKVEFANNLLKRYNKPSLILRFHVKEDGSWTTTHISNMMSYIFDHQRDLTDAGVYGIIYDKWENSSSTGPELILNNEKGGKFCSLQKNALKVLGLTRSIAFSKVYAKENCTCEKCNVWDKMKGACGNLVCVGGGQCYLPAGEDPADYTCPDRCVLNPSCQLCNETSYTEVNCTIKYPNETVENIVYNPKHFNELYGDIISSIATPSRCCLLEGNETESKKYTFVKHTTTRQKNEQVIFPTYGKESIDCGKPPKEGERRTCFMQVPMEDKEIVCLVK